MKRIAIFLLLSIISLPLAAYTPETMNRAVPAFWQGWLIAAAKADGHSVHSAQARFDGRDVVIDLRCRGSLGAKRAEVSTAVRDLVAYICFSADIDPIIEQMQACGARLVVTAAGTSGAKATTTLTVKQILHIAGANIEDTQPEPRKQ